MYVLVLNGLGVKGVITDTFLRTLHHKLGIQISDFDLILTTGMATIAVFPQSEAFFEPATLRKVFDKVHWDESMREVQTSSVSHGVAKSIVLRQLFGNQKLDPSFAIRIPLCNTTTNEIEWFRNGVEMSKICDASSAIIPYFPSVEIDSLTWTNGARSDLLQAIYVEAQKLFGLKAIIRMLVIDVDGVQIRSEPNWGAIPWIQHNLTSFLYPSYSRSSLETIQWQMRKDNVNHRLLYLKAKLCETIHLFDTRPDSLDLLKRAGQELVESYATDLIDFMNVKSCRTWNYQQH